MPNESVVSISADVLLAAVELRMLVKDNYEYIDREMLDEIERSITHTLEYIQAKRTAAESARDGRSEFLKMLGHKE
jgi:hypothetical protein